MKQHLEILLVLNGKYELNYLVMRIIITWIIICLLFNYNVSYGQKSVENNNIEEVQEGLIKVKEGKFKNKGYKDYPKKIKADYYTLRVLENRNDPESRIIELPVIRLHALNQEPKAPVFLSFGGPGMSNIWKYPRLWLLDNHDIVMVGYRGIDGTVSLDADKIGEAFRIDSNAFSTAHIEKIGQAYKEELQRFESEGIDIACYNMIDVIDDMELARESLGYEKINLFGSSYGTRVTYLYSLRYPNSIHRIFNEAVNSPGRFVWDPEETDAVLFQYGKLWQKDSTNLKRSPDIVATMQNVLSTLPVKWKKIHIDAEKVRIMMFNFLYSTHGARQIFDAFVAAENDDYSGLAFLVMMYDMFPEMDYNWGDSFLKAVSADYNPAANYNTAMNSKNNLVGAPMSKMFAIVEYSDWDVKLIPGEYRKLDTSYVEILMANGNLDVSTPLRNSLELMEYLPNGHLVVFSDCGHQDAGNAQMELFRKMVKEFYVTGEVKDDEFVYHQVNLSEPKTSLQKMGKMFYFLKRVGLSKTVAKLMM